MKIVYAYLETGAEHRGVPAAVLFAVGRKSVRDAVSRNRIKRLLREAYRQEKKQLPEKREIAGNVGISKTLCLAFIFNGSGCCVPSLEVLRREISRLLFTIRNS